MSRYVGARYVPVPMGDWDNSVNYEPLSMVTVEGDTYISKKYVPAGIGVSNTSYWAKMSVFSQQLARISMLYTEMAGQITDIIGDVDSIEDDIDGLTDDLETAQNDITATKTNLRNLGSRFMTTTCSITIDSTAAGASNSGSATIQTADELDPIGIVGAECNGPLALKSFWLSGTTAVAHVYNMDSVAHGGEVLLTVLYYNNAAL